MFRTVATWNSLALFCIIVLFGHLQRALKPSPTGLDWDKIGQGILATMIGERPYVTLQTISYFCYYCYFCYFVSCYFGHILFVNTWLLDHIFWQFNAENPEIPEGSHMFPCHSFSYIALNILKLWQDVEAETVSLTAGSVSTIHKVSKSQN